MVYHGDGRLLDPAKLNRISSQMVDKAAEPGIENTIIESYVDSREYDGDVDIVEEPLEQISGDPQWHGMLNVARRVLNTVNLPNEAELATAVDRCYFAMYHALCHNNACALAGSPRERRPDDWSRVYMGMGEGTIPAQFRQYRPQAPDEVKVFGAAFAVVQEHRDRAMEPPTSAYHPSEVIRLIQRAESAIVALESISREDQYSLAINLLVGIVPRSNRNISTAPDPSRTSTG